MSIIPLKHWLGWDYYRGLRVGATETQKGRFTLFFHPDSKTNVADHQQLKSAICAAAISSTRANQIVRQFSWCLPSGTKCNRPHAGKVL
jgi:hypothetical protein